MFQQNTIYHVYNQSNQRQVIFRQDVDYTDFEEKLRKHLLPIADILCYCLMPTHFHIMLLPKGIACQAVREDNPKVQQLHAAIRIMLSSFTRKLNLRYDSRGSIFRAKTKYKPAYTDFLPESWELNEELPFTRYIPYLQVCFKYIHRNPLIAGLVDSPERWPYGSASDYASMTDKKICNYQLTERLLGIRRL